MPIKGQSPKQIVKTEMHKWKHGSLHSGSKHGPLVRSQKQAIAIALSESGQSNKKADGGRITAQDMADAAARRLKTQPYRMPPPSPPELPDVGEPLIGSGTPKARGGFASGGMGGFNPERAAAIGLSRQGMIHSAVPGRTDKLNLNVPSGSYIIPADIPGAIGQGNSLAGGAILDKMFHSGPYGMNLGRAAAGSRVGPRHSSLMKQMHFAKGGKSSVAPIVAAGGEYVVHPQTVAALGEGDIDLGHSILDKFVEHVRKKHISTLKGLKPPKGSK